MMNELFGCVKKFQTENLVHVIKLAKDINAKNARGQTALHIAVRHGNKSAVELLLMNGADVDVIDKKGKTPIEYASIKKQIEIYKEQTLVKQKEE